MGSIQVYDKRTSPSGWSHCLPWYTWYAQILPSPPDRVFTHDMALVQHLTEVASHTGISYCNERRAHMPMVLNSGPTLGAKSVTLENSPTAPGTLGNYQPLALGLINRVRYWEHTQGLITERSHLSYHIQYLLRSFQHQVTSHHITWVAIWYYTTSQSHGSTLHCITLSQSALSPVSTNINQHQYQHQPVSTPLYITKKTVSENMVN